MTTRKNTPGPVRRVGEGYQAITEVDRTKPPKGRLGVPQRPAPAPSERKS